MRASAALVALSLLAETAHCATGIVGFGIDPYPPPCAHACKGSISSFKLSCSHDIEEEGHSHGPSAMTPPSCRAQDEPYLSTLAWCMHAKCSDIPTSQLQGFWEKYGTDDPSVAAKWDYPTALASSKEPSEPITKDTTVLNFTAITDENTYLAQYNSMTAVYRETKIEAIYSITILVVAFAIPILTTWLGYLPFMSHLVDKAKPYLVYPALIGKYQVNPLPHRLGNAPTVGQTLYLAIFTILLVVFCSVSYEIRQPHAWFATAQKEITAYIFYRTGYLAFALLPLVLLFSSRNNILLWVTNWSHSTFLLLHRWVARLCALLALFHTLLALPLYYPREAQKEYWIWGAVATICLVLLVVTSGLYVRATLYELFLASHIVLSVFALAGCWYHIYYWLPLAWGYEAWIYAACAVWFFDRLFRFGRVLKAGLRRSRVVDLGEGYLRIDIDGLRWGAAPGSHVYAYFPTANKLRPWENHPFSIIPTALLASRGGSGSASPVLTESADLEKRGVTRERTKAVRDGFTTAGVTLLVKTAEGATKLITSSPNLLTLLDGPYTNTASASKVLKCDRLLLVAGGIGITGVIPYVSLHPNIKLLWSVKQTAECLVKELDGALQKIEEKDVRVGSRIEISSLFAEEAEAGWARVGVVVSGPGSLCDDVRAAVVAAAKRGNAVFELEVDAYSW